MYTSRDLALVAVFTALLLGYGYLSSVALRASTRSLDLFFLISAVFAILTRLVQQSWSATLVATVTGLIFLGTPAPFSPHIAASLMTNGAIFDVYLKLTGNRENPTTRYRLVVAAALGSFAMAGVGLLLLQAVGVSFPLFVWPLALIGDTVVGMGGAAFGLAVAKMTGESLVTRLTAKR